VPGLALASPCLARRGFPGCPNGIHAAGSRGLLGEGENSLDKPFNLIYHGENAWNNKR